MKYDTIPVCYKSVRRKSAQYGILPRGDPSAKLATLLKSFVFFHVFVNADF